MTGDIKATVISRRLIIIFLIYSMCSYVVDMFLHIVKQRLHQQQNDDDTTGRLHGNDKLRLVNTHCSNAAQRGLKTECHLANGAIRLVHTDSVGKCLTYKNTLY